MLQSLDLLLVYYLTCVGMQIPEPDSQYVRKSDCDTIFIVANFQPDKKDAANAVNDEHALMRFEFLEAIVRLAIAKYGKVWILLCHSHSCAYASAHTCGRNAVNDSMPSCTATSWVSYSMPSCITTFWVSRRGWLLSSIARYEYFAPVGLNACTGESDCKLMTVAAYTLHTHNNASAHVVFSSKAEGVDIDSLRRSRAVH